MFVLPGYTFRHDVLLNKCGKSRHVFMPWTLKRWAWCANMWFCTEVDWVMHGSITKWPLTLTLSRFKRAPLFFVGAFTEPSYLIAGISLELHLGAAWPYKPYRTGCEGPVQSMSARSAHYIRMSVPSDPYHFALVSFTLVVQIRLYFGSDGNRCRLTPSLVVLMQPAATHRDGIIENNKLQTWEKTLGIFFSSKTLHAVLGKCCVDRG